MSCFDYPVDSQTILLKKRALRKELLQKEGLVDKKIAILSGSTVGQIRPVLELFCCTTASVPPSGRAATTCIMRISSLATRS